MATLLLLLLLLSSKGSGGRVGPPLENGAMVQAKATSRQSRRTQAHREREEGRVGHAHPCSPGSHYSPVEPSILTVIKRSMFTIAQSKIQGPDSNSNRTISGAGIRISGVSFRVPMRMDFRYASFYVKENLNTAETNCKNENLGKFQYNHITITGRRPKFSITIASRCNHTALLLSFFFHHISWLTQQSSGARTTTTTTMLQSHSAFMSPFPIISPGSPYSPVEPGQRRRRRRCCNHTAPL